MGTTVDRSSGRTRRPRGSLTAAEVVDAAAALLRDEGLDGFSMRKLADRLGVAPMTLYLRFESRDDLLDAVIEAATDDQLGIPRDVDWREQLVAWTLGVRAQLLRIQPLLPLVGSGRDLGITMQPAIEAGVAIVTDGDLAPDRQADAFRTLFWHAVGSALAHDAMTRLAPDARAAAPELLRDAPDLDPDVLFEASTRALVASLAEATP